MKFVVGLAAGVALAAAAYVYAQRDPVMQEAIEGVQADLKAGDSEALKARLEAALAEVRSQVKQRVGPQSDWAIDAGDTLLVAADEVGGAAAGGAGGSAAAVDVAATADELAPPAEHTEPTTQA